MSDKFIIKAQSPFVADMEGYMALDMSFDYHHAWRITTREHATPLTEVEAWIVTSALHEARRWRDYRFTFELKEEKPNG